MVYLHEAMSLAFFVETLSKGAWSELSKQTHRFDNTTNVPIFMRSGLYEKHPRVIWEHGVQ